MTVYLDDSVSLAFQWADASVCYLLLLSLPVGGGLAATPVEQRHLQAPGAQRTAELLVHLLVDARHAQEQRGPHLLQSLDQRALRTRREVSTKARGAATLANMLRPVHGRTYSYTRTALGNALRQYAQKYTPLSMLDIANMS